MPIPFRRGERVAEQIFDLGFERNDPSIYFTGGNLVAFEFGSGRIHALERIEFACFPAIRFASLWYPYHDSVFCVSACQFARQHLR